MSCCQGHFFDGWMAFVQEADIGRSEIFGDSDLVFDEDQTEPA